MRRPRRTASDPKVVAELNALPPELRAVGRKLAALVRSTAPELSESLKWGNPVWVGRKNAVCIMIYADHVNLGLFRGAELAKSYPQIEGTGKSLRHIKIHTSADVDNPVVRQVLRDAVRLDRG